MSKIFQCNNLYVSYGRNTIVSDISFSLDEGELCGILGENGSGKTTLLKGIMGAHAKAKGECYVKGNNIISMSPKKRAQLISALPQNIEVPEGFLVEDIIEMGYYPRLKAFRSVTKDMENEIFKIMESLEITKLMGCYFDKLSQGQKQKVLLARTLIQNTPVIFLDEPDSALDFKYKHSMFKIIKKLLKDNNKSGICILHDPSLALSYCDKVIIMRDGHKISEIIPRKENTKDIEKKLEYILGNIEIHYTGEFYQVWCKNN